MTEAGWTREKPSKEGVYWFRWTVNSNSLIVSVAKDDCDWRVLEMGHQYDGALAGYGDGEWLGPITPDSFQQGRVAGLREASRKASDAVPLLFGTHPNFANYIADALMDFSDILNEDADKLAQAAQDEKGVGE